MPRGMTVSMHYTMETTPKASVHLTIAAVLLLSPKPLRDLLPMQVAPPHAGDGTHEGNCCGADQAGRGRGGGA